MWATYIIRNSARREDVSRPVPRTQRMQRLDRAPMPSTPPTDGPDKLKQFAHRLDSWSEARSNKSILESWMCTYTTIHSYHHTYSRLRSDFAPCSHRYGPRGYRYAYIHKMFITDTLGFSITGLYVADWLEDKYPETGNASRAQSRTGPQLSRTSANDEHTPRFFSISIVDRS